MHVDLVAGDGLAAALDGCDDFSLEMLTMKLASVLSSGGRLRRACLVVDDGERGRDERENSSDLHCGCSNWMFAL